jgi:hypothetical protein
MAREREDYYLQVKAKMLAVLILIQRQAQKPLCSLTLQRRSSRPVTAGG